MSILAQILENKRAEVAALDRDALRQAAEQRPAPRDFVAEIDRRRSSGSPALIAELKRASPSKGVLAAGIDLLQVAQVYTGNGAAAISVLTDAKFFQGSLDTLRQVRDEKKIGLPLLRKDFIIDEAQLYEARAAGADAVLLIAAALPDDARLADLHALALSLGMAPLVEVHDQGEAERALRLEGLRLIGINNRNLDTFEVSLATTERLRPMIPQGIRVVAESGIFCADDVARLAQAGVDAVLVGEALVTATDIAVKVRELSGMSQPTAEGRPA
jgi:indole-3-glycerol phosphate synthase